jgi:hypothetical protein
MATYDLIPKIVTENGVVGFFKILLKIVLCGTVTPVVEILYMLDLFLILIFMAKIELYRRISHQIMGCHRKGKFNIPIKQLIEFRLYLV